MIALKSFIEQIIYIAIVAVIIEIIMPKGNTKKYVYVVLSLFLFLNILSPVINVLKDVDMKQTVDNVLQTISSNTQTENAVDINEFSEYTNIKLKKELESKLEVDLNPKLMNLGIKLKKVNIKTDKDNNFKNIEIVTQNLEYLGDDKISKLSDAIKLVSDTYSVDENTVIISEEG